MARPKSPDNLVSFTLYVPKKLLKTAKELARNTKPAPTTPAAIMREAVRVGLQAMIDVDRIRGDA